VIDRYFADLWNDHKPGASNEILSPDFIFHPPDGATRDRAAIAVWSPRRVKGCPTCSLSPRI
jgi:hypothetical protein